MNEEIKVMIIALCVFITYFTFGSMIIAFIDGFSDTGLYSKSHIDSDFVFLTIFWPFSTMAFIFFALVEVAANAGHFIGDRLNSRRK